MEAKEAAGQGKDPIAIPTNSQLVTLIANLAGRIW